jgi:hypothetical protein
MDSAIRDDKNIREAVWDLYELDKDMPYPFLTKELIYGALSYIVHNYEYRTVLVSDQAPPDFSKFFEALAKYQGRTLEYFSATAAAMGKTLV